MFKTVLKALNWILFLAAWALVGSGIGILLIIIERL